MDRGDWWATVHGVPKSWTWLNEKEMATHSSTLAWRIPGTGEPGGLPSMGSHRVRHEWSVSTFIAAAAEWLTHAAILQAKILNICQLIKYWLWDAKILFYWLLNWMFHFCCCYCSISKSYPVKSYLCNPTDCSTPGFPVLHCFLEFAQTHVHWVIQSSHPLLPPSPPALKISQHQGLSQWIGSSHKVAKVLGLQLQHQSFQWIFRTDFL